MIISDARNLKQRCPKFALASQVKNNCLTISVKRPYVFMNLNVSQRSWTWRWDYHCVAQTKARWNRILRMYPNLGKTYQLLSHYSIKTITNYIEFEIVNILVKLFGLFDNLDVGTPLIEGLVRYIKEEEWQNGEPTNTKTYVLTQETSYIHSESTHSSCALLRYLSVRRLGRTMELDGNQIHLLSVRLLAATLGQYLHPCIVYPTAVATWDDITLTQDTWMARSNLPRIASSGKIFVNFWGMGLEGVLKLGYMYLSSSKHDVLTRT